MVLGIIATILALVPVSWLLPGGGPPLLSPARRRRTHSEQEPLERMKRTDSEQFAFWVCRRLFGRRLAPYDRCFQCGQFHTPPSDQHPHNGRYDFTSPQAAVEVVSIVDSDVLRNFSSWGRRYTGPREAEPSVYGLTEPWVIGIPAQTPTSDLDKVLETVRSMEDAGIYSTAEGDSRNRQHHARHPGQPRCPFCEIAYTALFTAHTDYEGLITERPGLATISIETSLRQSLPDIDEILHNLLNPTIQLRSDVMQKLDRGAQHGKARRVVCFVLNDIVSYGLFLDELKNTELYAFDWDELTPLTDVVLCSPVQKRALVFSRRMPARSLYIRDAVKAPHPRTLGCTN